MDITFMGRMLFLMTSHQCQGTESNEMLIYWFISTSFKDLDIAEQIVAMYPHSIAFGWM